MISKEGVTKLLKGLNLSKAFCPDELHPRVIKKVASEIGPVFAHLFQQSIDPDEIPKEWSPGLQVFCLQVSPNVLDLRTLQTSGTCSMF